LAGTFSSIGHLTFTDFSKIRIVTSVSFGEIDVFTANSYYVDEYADAFSDT